MSIPCCGDGQPPRDIPRGAGNGEDLPFRLYLIGRACARGFMCLSMLLFLLLRVCVCACAYYDICRYADTAP